MLIEFKKNKDLNAYKEFVENPTDRNAMRSFLKFFPKEIATESVRRHQLLSKYPTALDYNKVYGQTANRIELKMATKGNTPLILKVRVSGSWREFFTTIKEDGNQVLSKDWNGCFEDVKSLFVIDVNKHDYNAV